MNKILWNVDTQYDFMRADGALSIPGAQAIEENLTKITALGRRKGVQIVNTADWHTLESEEISDKPDYVHTFPAHCLVGTKGAEFVPATKPNNPYTIDWRDRGFDIKAVLQSGELVLYKDKFKIFAGNPHADGVLRAINPATAIVYGVATNVCVDGAVCGLLDRGVKVYVLTDAIKEIPSLPLPHEKWRAKGAKLVTTGELERIIGE